MSHGSNMTYIEAHGPTDRPTAEPTDTPSYARDKQYQKRYMVAGSLCLIVFIIVEYDNSLVVIIHYKRQRGPSAARRMEGLWGS